MKSRQDEKFMRMAIDKARSGIRRGQTPFGACIVRKNKLVSCAHNQVWDSTDITAHAEIRAIRLACRKLKTVDLSGCVIYSTCEPCPMCFSACHWAGISKIVYGAKIRDAKKAGFNELAISSLRMKKWGGSRIKVVAGFLPDENRRLFDEWLANPKRKAY